VFADDTVVWIEQTLQTWAKLTNSHLGIDHDTEWKELKEEREIITYGSKSRPLVTYHEECRASDVRQYQLFHQPRSGILYAFIVEVYPKHYPSI
jgi:hypothetical protein